MARKAQSLGPKQQMVLSEGVTNALQIIEGVAKKFTTQREQRNQSIVAMYKAFAPRIGEDRHLSDEMFAAMKHLGFIHSRGRRTDNHWYYVVRATMFRNFQKLSTAQASTCSNYGVWLESVRFYEAEDPIDVLDKKTDGVDAELENLWPFLEKFRHDKAALTASAPPVVEPTPLPPPSPLHRAEVGPAATKAGPSIDAVRERSVTGSADEKRETDVPGVQSKRRMSRADYDRVTIYLITGDDGLSSEALGEFRHEVELAATRIASSLVGRPSKLELGRTLPAIDIADVALACAGERDEVGSWLFNDVRVPPASVETTAASAPQPERPTAPPEPPPAEPVVGPAPQPSEVPKSKRGRPEGSKNKLKDEKKAADHGSQCGYGSAEKDAMAGASPRRERYAFSDFSDKPATEGYIAAWERAFAEGYTLQHENVLVEVARGEKFGREDGEKQGKADALAGNPRSPSAHEYDDPENANAPLLKGWRQGFDDAYVLAYDAATQESAAEQS